MSPVHSLELSNQKNDDQLSVETAVQFSIMPDWDDLLARVNGSVFMSSIWLHAWQKTIGKDKQTFLIRISSENKLRAAAAFVKTGGKTLSLAGEGASDYFDVLIDPDLTDDAAQACLNLLFSNAMEKTRWFSELRLQRLDPHSRALALVGNSFRFALHSDGAVAPRMDMEHVDAALNKKSLKRHFRKLSQSGVLLTQTFKNEEEIASKLESFFELHVKRWQNTRFPSIFGNESYREFYRTLTPELCNLGILRYSEVLLDGRLLAAHYGFLHNNTFTWYKPCYDPDFAKFSPGEVLIKHLLEQARNEKARIFDFTIGSEAFKFRFATHTPTTQNLVLTDSSFMHAYRKLGRSIKSISER